MSISERIFDKTGESQTENTIIGVPCISDNKPRTIQCWTENVPRHTSISERLFDDEPKVGTKAPVLPTVEHSRYATAYMCTEAPSISQFHSMELFNHDDFPVKEEDPKSVLTLGDVEPISIRPKKLEPVMVAHQEEILEPKDFEKSVTPPPEITEDSSVYSDGEEEISYVEK